MITSDYSHAPIVTPEELRDLRCIADRKLSEITLDNSPRLLIFPDSFQQSNGDLGQKVIGSIITNSEGQEEFHTNSIVGFVGYNTTKLSIHSRFTNDGDEDFFLHYMLQRVARVNILDLKHTTTDESVFDFLIYLFPQYLKKALNQGLYKRYVSRKYNDANVRGAIDVSRHIRYNYPFNGKVAYATREYSYDNEVTQLIRHTIEYIDATRREILALDAETKEAISLIRSATPSYELRDRRTVLGKNLRSIAHPYYSEYTSLQRLCLQILRREELKFGAESDEIYGILIDAAWLWEEYVAVVLEDDYNHYLKERGKRFNLFDDFQQIIPDYISKDMRIVADAKYIRLNREARYDNEEKATAIYYKTITYMYRFCTDRAYLFYPHPENMNGETTELRIKSEQLGKNGGSITKLGLKVALNCATFEEFVTRMENYEREFIEEARRYVTK